MWDRYGGSAAGGSALGGSACGGHASVPLLTHSGSAWACPSMSAPQIALMIVSPLAPAITARCANFLIVSSPVRVGLMPSLPPGFSAPEAPRQGRPTLAVPAAGGGDFGAPLQPVELGLGPLAAPAAGLEFVRAGSSEGALGLQLWRQLRDRARLVL